MTQTVSLYDAAYNEGYNAALRELKELKELKKKQGIRTASHIREYKPEAGRREKSDKIGFMIGQKLAGTVLLAASVIGLVANEGDFAVALFTIPLALFVFLTNERLFK